MKCSGEHKHKDCNIKNNDLLKCANCNSNHASNSRDCPVYNKLLNTKTMNGQSKRTFSKFTETGNKYSANSNYIARPNLRIDNRSYRDVVNGPLGEKSNKRSNINHSSSFMGLMSDL